LGTRRQAIWEMASFFQEGQIGYGKKFLNIWFFYSFFDADVCFSEVAKPLLMSSRTAAVRLGIRCRNLKSSMALSSSSGIATCRRSIRWGLDVICRIEFSN
jgi:hypothetical protein